MNTLSWPDFLGAGYNRGMAGAIGCQAVERALALIGDKMHTVTKTVACIILRAVYDASIESVLQEKIISHNWMRHFSRLKAT